MNRLQNSTTTVAMPTTKTRSRVVTLFDSFEFEYQLDSRASPIRGISRFPPILGVCTPGVQPIVAGATQVATRYVWPSSSRRMEAACHLPPSSAPFCRRSLCTGRSP
jgi:hypothetical protein